MSDIDGESDVEASAVMRNGSPGSKPTTDGDSKSQFPVPYNEDRREDEDEVAQLQRLFTAERVASHVSHAGLKLRMGGGKAIPAKIPKELYVVDFDGPDDPLHPHNRSFWNKAAACLSLGLTTCSVAFGSAIFAAAIPAVSLEFHVSQVVATLGISLYIVGFAGGPVFWGSMSEYYGRKMPTLVSQFGMVLFSFGSATAKDFQTLMLCRFFAGFIGSAPFSVAGGAFTDQFSSKDRGKSLIVYLSMVFVGPTLAPVIGGFVTESYLGWRWTQYLTGIFGSAVLVMDYFLYEESFHPVVLVSKAKRMREETGNWAIHAVAENSNFELSTLVHNLILRPLKLLVTQPIVMLISIYIAFVYGILYLCLEVYPIIFIQGYGFSPGVGELPYIGILVGMLCGGVYLWMWEPRYGRISDKNGGRPCPDLRLDAMIIPSLLFPVGLFWLTWSGHYHEHVHFMVPTVGGAVIGFSLLSIFLSSICYMVESYIFLVASVMAANSFLRAAFAAAFPLFARAMFTNMGVQWAGTLLGCVAIALVPIPFLFRMYAPALKKTIKV